MNIETYLLCLKISKGEATGEEYSNWAISQLLKDIDTPSIRILSSFMKPVYKPEAEEYFYKSLKELGWEFPPFYKSTLKHIKFLAGKIIDGTFEPIKTAHEIFTYVRDLGYPSDLTEWLEIGDLIDEKIYTGSSQVSDEMLIKRIIEEAQKLV